MMQLHFGTLLRCRYFVKSACERFVCVCVSDNVVTYITYLSTHLPTYFSQLHGVDPQTTEIMHHLQDFDQEHSLDNSRDNSLKYSEDPNCSDTISSMSPDSATHLQLPDTTKLVADGSNLSADAQQLLQDLGYGSVDEGQAGLEHHQADAEGDVLAGGEADGGMSAVDAGSGLQDPGGEEMQWGYGDLEDLAKVAEDLSGIR